METSHLVAELAPVVAQLLALAVPVIIALGSYSAFKWMLTGDTRAHYRAIEKARAARELEEAPKRLREQQRKDREMSHQLWMEEFHTLGGCPRRFDLRRALPGHVSIECPTCNDVPVVQPKRRHLRKVS